MSLNVVVTTFLFVTLPVAAISLFKKSKKHDYLALSDFKKFHNIFHSFSDNPEVYRMIEYRSNNKDSYYTEIDYDYIDIWDED